MKSIQPPALLEEGFSIFLAGSIEMGTAEDWQARIAASLTAFDVLIFNPRRENWDASWEQTKDNPLFREQVEWELAALERANLIVMYLVPETKSPISLLELGLFGRSDKMVVCCPPGFWRKGNVDIVCERYGIEQVESLEEAIRWVSDHLTRNSIRPTK
ncbi:MAG: nucleoside 2-deoxyribosyltransferase domain-containing protein [Anaerolineales bacterium]|nr:nucleoside 2-deoxyribosyltransferase domain-containing protein [Anaerolineales bacterium]